MLVVTDKKTKGVAMLTLPKVDKGVKQAITRLEKAQKVIASAALAIGVLIANAPATDAHASAAPQQTRLSVNPASGSLLLTSPAQTAGGMMVARHYSHSSHYSHASHNSHYSHYSSRY